MRSNRKNKKGKMIGLMLIAAVIVAGGALGYSYYYAARAVAKSPSAILKNVTIDGIDVGGLTKAQALKKITDRIDASAPAAVTLKAGDRSKDVRYSDLGLTFDAAGAVEDAYSLGRKGWPFKRFGDALAAKKGESDVKIDIKADDSIIKKVIKTNEPTLVRKAENAKITVTGGKVAVIDGKNGHSIDSAASVKAVKKAVAENWTGKPVSVRLVVKEASPSITTADLKGLTDIMGTFQTDYSWSSYNRCRNIENAASKINGTLLKPGETFSVYKTISPFTSENGYYKAGTIQGKKHVDDFGGGICQVATTLYNAAIRAELNVIERHNHSQRVWYVPISADATIANEEVDFRFENNGDKSVYIAASAGGGTLRMTVFGADSRPAGRTVTFESVTTDVINYGTRVVGKDKALEEGKKRVELPGVTGYRGQMWKIVKVNGKVTERTLFNSSSYSKVDQEVIIGAKKKAVKPVPTPPDPAAKPKPAVPAAPKPADPSPAPAPAPSDSAI